MVNTEQIQENVNIRYQEAQRWEKEKILRRNNTIAPNNNNQDFSLARMNHSRHFPELRTNQVAQAHKQNANQVRQPTQNRQTYSFIANCQQSSISNNFVRKSMREMSTQTDQDDTYDSPNKQIVHESPDEIKFTMKTLATFLIRILDTRVIEAKGNKKAALVKNILKEVKDNNTSLLSEEEEIESSIEEGVISDDCEIENESTLVNSQSQESDINKYLKNKEQKGTIKRKVTIKIGKSNIDYIYNCK